MVFSFLFIWHYVHDIRLSITIFSILQKKLPEYLSRRGFFISHSDVKMFTSPSLTSIFGKENVCLFKFPGILVISSMRSHVQMIVSDVTFESIGAVTT